MIITEDLITGAKYFQKPVYPASVDDPLQIMLCTKPDVFETIQGFTQFSDSRKICPWWTNKFKKVTYLSESPVKHKVFTEEEVEFLIDYEGLGEMSLDLLMYLAEPYDRCTFNVNSDVFLRLLAGLPDFVTQFKYNSNIRNVEDGYNYLRRNYMLGISFYNIDTFLYNIYGKKQEGLGLAFEIFDKNKSVQMPVVPVGYYILLANQYEGLFYIDGKEAIPLKISNFESINTHFKSLLSYCNEPSRTERNKNLINIAVDAVNTVSVEDVDGAYLKYLEEQQKIAPPEYLNAMDILWENDPANLASEPVSLSSKIEYRKAEKNPDALEDIPIDISKVAKSMQILGSKKEYLQEKSLREYAKKTGTPSYWGNLQTKQREAEKYVNTNYVKIKPDASGGFGSVSSSTVSSTGFTTGFINYTTSW
jgi:hypothetical protein